MHPTDMWLRSEPFSENPLSIETLHQFVHIDRYIPDFTAAVAFAADSSEAAACRVGRRDGRHVHRRDFTARCVRVGLAFLFGLLRFLAGGHFGVVGVIERLADVRAELRKAAFKSVYGVFDALTVKGESGLYQVADAAEDV